MPGRSWVRCNTYFAVKLSKARNEEVNRLGRWIRERRKIGLLGLSFDFAGKAAHNC